MSFRGDRLRETWITGIVALTCALVAATSATTSVRREATDPALSRGNGILLASGGPFTGEIVERWPDWSLASAVPYVEGLRDGTAPLEIDRVVEDVQALIETEEVRSPSLPDQAPS